jgi:uncharacterized protein YcfJ
MTKMFTIGAVAGVVIATAGGAVAGYKAISAPKAAEVVSSTLLTRTVKAARESCRDEQVTHVRPVKDKHRLVGTGVGAVAGGLLGNQFGGGKGKTLATAAGAVAGGYAGNRIQQKTQQGDTYTTTEKRCTTVYDSSEEPDGYDVVYVLDGKQHHVRMDRDPGKQIPVKDGQIVVVAEKA